MTSAIRVEGISKRYSIRPRGPAYATLRDALMTRLESALQLGGRDARPTVPEDFIWALHDVSFEVAQGEVIGIIGRNGAGKSTLLKIFARITLPTSGQAWLRGRVGSLLDVGTGFHSELTGRENIYLNGAVLGMTRRDTTRRLDEIVEFAGVDRFLDTPVKHYSDGMRMRLAFSVAAHLETEILLADEVLAVGDAAFQKKCLDQMTSLARSGRTVLFVSHSMTAVGQLCPKAVLLDKGRVIVVGKTEEVIRRYLGDLYPKTHSAAIEPPVPHKGMAITHVEVTDSNGAPNVIHDWRFPTAVTVDFDVTRPIPTLSVGLALINPIGIRVLFSWIVFQKTFEPGRYRARGLLCGELLNPGQYHVTVDAEDYGGEYYHCAPAAVSFEIVDSTGEFGLDIENYGLVYSRVDWRVERSSEPVTAPAPSEGNLSRR